jgi:hypothetical protein
VLGDTRFISRVEHDISLVRCAHSWDIMFNTRNKSGISAHPCIILYIPIYHCMCYTKCNAGGLRACSCACSIVLKTQYLLWKSWQYSSWILCEIFYTKLVHWLYETNSYRVQYIMLPKCLVFANWQGDVMPWSWSYKRNMCICIYKNIIKRYFILYKYFIVNYII